MKAECLFWSETGEELVAAIRWEYAGSSMCWFC